MLPAPGGSQGTPDAPGHRPATRRSRAPALLLPALPGSGAPSPVVGCGAPLCPSYSLPQAKARAEPPAPGSDAHRLPPGSPALPAPYSRPGAPLRRRGHHTPPRLCLKPRARAEPPAPASDCRQLLPYAPGAPRRAVPDRSRRSSVLPALPGASRRAPPKARPPLPLLVIASSQGPSRTPCTSLWPPPAAPQALPALPGAPPRTVPGAPRRSRRRSRRRSPARSSALPRFRPPAARVLVPQDGCSHASGAPPRALPHWFR